MLKVGDVAYSKSLEDVVYLTYHHCPGFLCEEGHDSVVKWHSTRDLIKLEDLNRWIS